MAGFYDDSPKPKSRERDDVSIGYSDASNKRCAEKLAEAREAAEVAADEVAEAGKAALILRGRKFTVKRNGNLCEFRCAIHGFDFTALEHEHQPTPRADGCGAYGKWTPERVRDAMKRFRMTPEVCIAQGLEPAPNAPNETTQGVNETHLSHTLEPWFHAS